MFVFRKIWRPLFSWNARFKNHLFALLLTRSCLLLLLALPGLIDTLLQCCQLEGSCYDCPWGGNKGTWYGNIFSREKYIKLYFYRYQTDLYPNFVQDDLFVKLYWWDYIVIPFVKEGIVQRDKFDVFNVNNQNTKAITRCYPAIFQVN